MCYNLQLFGEYAAFLFFFFLQWKNINSVRTRTGSDSFTLLSPVHLECSRKSLNVYEIIEIGKGKMDWEFYREGVKREKERRAVD